MENWTALLLVGALGAASCGNDDKNGDASGGTTSPASTPAPATVATVPDTVTKSESQLGDALFNDSFDDDRNGWGVVDDPQFGSTAFADGDQVWDFREVSPTSYQRCSATSTTAVSSTCATW
ncbi:MAG: hypothetical protein WKF58_16305 [Ilumatobacteraceae bacterium]